MIVLGKIEIVRKNGTVEGPRDCAVCCGAVKTCTVKVSSENRYFKRKPSSTPGHHEKKQKFIL